MINKYLNDIFNLIINILVMNSNICSSCNSKVNYLFLNGKICKFCDIIKNLKLTRIQDITICYSKIPQYDIINKTISYFQENNKMPEFKQIDHDVKKINISTLEYYNAIFNNNLPDYIKNNYKLFINHNINMIHMPYVNDVYDDSEFEIIDSETNDPDEEEYDFLFDDYEFDHDLPEYEMNDKEILFFKPKNNIKETIKIMESIHNN